MFNFKDVLGLQGGRRKSACRACATPRNRLRETETKTTKMELHLRFAPEERNLTGESMVGMGMPTRRGTEGIDLLNTVNSKFLYFPGVNLISETLCSGKILISDADEDLLGVE
jgi:hypothetical protein